MKDLWAGLVIGVVALVASIIGITVWLAWADWICDSDLFDCVPIGPYR